MKPRDETDEVADPPSGLGETRERVELARSFTAGMLELLSGKIVAASDATGVLELEVEPERGGNWRLEAANSDLSPTDSATLLTLAVERVELEADSNALRCSLSDGSRLVVTPRQAAEDDRPSWRVELAQGIALKHLHRPPWLFTDLPDEL